MVYRSLITLSLFLSCLNTQAICAEKEEIEWEKKKMLNEFSLTPYEETVNAIYSSDDDEHTQTEEERKLLEESNRSLTVTFLNLCAKSDRERALKEAAKTDDERRKEKLEAVTRKRKIDAVEKEIATGIRGFNGKFSTDLVLVERTTYWADTAADIGNHFQKRRRPDDADYFYKLAGKGVEEGYCNNKVHASQGYMRLGMYNDEIRDKRTIQPTSSLFHNLLKTIDAFSVASQYDDVAEFAMRDLIKAQQMIVRWHVSVNGLLNDPRSDQLIKISYNPSFVQGILSAAKRLSIFAKANRYDGLGTEEDLSKHLRDLGFIGIAQSDTQHNWVHPNGFMVRIKSESEYTGYPEYTVGITMKNPIIWNNDGSPKQLSYLGPELAAFNPKNEIFKLAYDGKAVFVVPAFRADRKRKKDDKNQNREWEKFWHDPKESKNMMKYAHFPLRGSFGEKAKLEAILSFVEVSGKIVRKHPPHQLTVSGSSSGSPSAASATPSTSVTVVMENFEAFIKGLNLSNDPTTVEELYTTKLGNLEIDLKVGKGLAPQYVIDIFAKARDARQGFLLKLMPYMLQEKHMHEELVRAFPTADTIMDEFKRAVDKSSFIAWEKQVKEYAKDVPDFPMEIIKNLLKSRYNIVVVEFKKYTEKLKETRESLRTLFSSFPSQLT